MIRASKDVVDWLIRNGKIPASAVPRATKPRKKSVLAVFKDRVTVTSLPLPFKLEVPVKVVSEMNSRECWQAKHRRKQAQQFSLIHQIRQRDVFESGPLPPFRVRLTRIGFNPMDGDNLQSALKHLRDAVAAWSGTDDRSKLIEWVYLQEVDRKRPARVIIEIESTASDFTDQ